MQWKHCKHAVLVLNAHKVSSYQAWLFRCPQASPIEEKGINLPTTNVKLDCHDFKRRHEHTGDQTWEFWVGRCCWSSHRDSDPGGDSNCAAHRDERTSQARTSESEEVLPCCVWLRVSRENWMFSIVGSPMWPFFFFVGHASPPGRSSHFNPVTHFQDTGGRSQARSDDVTEEW